MPARRRVAVKAPPPEPPEHTEGPLTHARKRALELARAGVLDADILATLRTELAAVRPQLAQPAELVRAMARWADHLEDARVAGRADVAHRLHQTANNPEARDSTTAAIFLAKRHDQPLGKELEAEQRALQKMSPAEFAGYVLELVARCGIAMSPRELADHILARAGA